MLPICSVDDAFLLLLCFTDSVYRIKMYFMAYNTLRMTTRRQEIGSIILKPQHNMIYTLHTQQNLMDI